MRTPIIVRAYRKLISNRQKKGLKSCGEKVHIHERCQFNHSDNITIGNNVSIQRDCTFSGHGGITIGDGVIISHCVDVFSGEHNYDSDDLEYIPFDERFVCAPVEIGECAWIGCHVIIMPGVKIGKGAIVGAGAVVTKDIPDAGIAVGVPAKVIGKRDEKRFSQLYEQERLFVKCCR